MTTPTIDATGIAIDIRHNELQILAPTTTPLGTVTTGIVDIGAQGRLLGIEIGDQYVAVMDDQPGAIDLTRSVEVPLRVSIEERDVRITLGRRGEDWEISYPSGNQCWTRRTVFDDRGQPLQVCAIVIPAPDIAREDGA